MESKVKTIISVQANINAPVELVWKLWSTPGDIIKWNNASEDWHTPRAENDLKAGGTFSYRMEARDGSMGLDFAGVYDKVVVNGQVEYTLGDGRKVNVLFTALGDSTRVAEAFEAEDINGIALQQRGWQAILDNFKKYAETQYQNSKPGL